MPFDILTDGRVTYLVYRITMSATLIIYKTSPIIYFSFLTAMNNTALITKRVLS